MLHTVVAPQQQSPPKADPESGVPANGAPSAGQATRLKWWAIDRYFSLRVKTIFIFGILVSLTVAAVGITCGLLLDRSFLSIEKSALRDDAWRMLNYQSTSATLMLSKAFEYANFALVRQGLMAAAAGNPLVLDQNMNTVFANHALRMRVDMVALYTADGTLLWQSFTHFGLSEENPAYLTSYPANRTFNGLLVIPTFVPMAGATAPMLGLTGQPVAYLLLGQSFSTGAFVGETAAASTYACVTYRASTATWPMTPDMEWAAERLKDHKVPLDSNLWVGALDYVVIREFSGDYTPGNSSIRHCPKYNNFKDRSSSFMGAAYTLLEDGTMVRMDIYLAAYSAGRIAMRNVLVIAVSVLILFTLVTIVYLDISILRRLVRVANPLKLPEDTSKSLRGDEVLMLRELLSRKLASLSQSIKGAQAEQIAQSKQADCLRQALKMLNCLSGLSELTENERGALQRQAEQRLGIGGSLPLIPLEDILDDGLCTEMFKAYCRMEGRLNHVLFLLALIAIHEIEYQLPSAELQAIARVCFTNHFGVSAPSPLKGVSDKTITRIRSKYSSPGVKIPVDAFDRAAREVVHILATEVVVRFYETPEYLHMLMLLMIEKGIPLNSQESGEVLPTPRTAEAKAQFIRHLIPEGAKEEDRPAKKWVQALLRSYKPPKKHLKQNVSTTALPTATGVAALSTSSGSSGEEVVSGTSPQ